MRFPMIRILLCSCQTRVKECKLKLIIVVLFPSLHFFRGVYKIHFVTSFPTDKTKPLQTKSDKGRLESLNKGSIDDPDILENTNLTMFRRKKSLDNERLNVLSYTDDGKESSEAPRFVTEPEDIAATLGKPLSLDCVVVGTKPIGQLRGLMIKLIKYA